MDCTLSNLSQEYFNVFMTNFMGVLGQTSSLLLSAVIVIPTYSFYSGKLFGLLEKVKKSISQQTETHNE